MRLYGAAGVIGGAIGVGAAVMAFAAVIFLVVLSVAYPPFGILLIGLCSWAWRDFKRRLPGPPPVDDRPSSLD